MGCCWPSRSRGIDEELGRKKDEDQPLIENKKSPTGGKGKTKKLGKAAQEPNPFHKPSKWSWLCVDSGSIVSHFMCRVGGSVIEETDEGKKVLRPFNANEINKPNPDDEEMP